MENRANIFAFAILLGVLLVAIITGGCAGKKPIATDQPMASPPLTMIQQIDSFSPEIASRQALEVINNNPYDQEFFEKVFARAVEQCKASKSPANADIVWDNLVVPLKQSGKVPPDLAKTTWNGYFSRQFVSLPSAAPVTHYCNRLKEIKAGIEREYMLKKAGYEATEQGSPDAHFLNAMYVYNTMWAACREAD